MQSTIAISSPESEYYSLVKGSSITIGIQSMLKDMMIDVGVQILSDASSGISLASRRGLGRARHISTRYLWIQQHVADKSIEVTKVPRKDNPSDIGTRCVTEAEIFTAFRQLSMVPALSMSPMT